ncbi:unnamed protein product, partial [Urochloa humidicola]
AAACSSLLALPTPTPPSSLPSSRCGPRPCLPRRRLRCQISSHHEPQALLSLPPILDGNVRCARVTVAGARRSTRSSYLRPVSPRRPTRGAHQGLSAHWRSRGHGEARAAGGPRLVVALRGARRRACAVYWISTLTSRSPASATTGSKLRAEEQGRHEPPRVCIAVFREPSPAVFDTSSTTAAGAASSAVQEDAVAVER